MKKFLIIVFSSILIFGLSSCGTETQTFDKPQVLIFTEKDNKISEDQVLIINRDIKPQFEETIGFKYIEKSDAENKAMIKQYKINEFPTIIIIKKDGNIIKTFPSEIIKKESIFDILITL